MRAIVSRLLWTTLALYALVAAEPLQAKTSEFSFAQDRFAAGDQVTVADAVKGDLIAAGSQINVSGEIGGTLIAGGGELRLDGPVEADLYAAGRQVILGAAIIKRNARLAGGVITLQPKAHIQGNVSLAGRELKLDGEVTGYLLAAGGYIYLNGPIGGDVRVAGNRIELGPKARIAGSLHYRSKNELKRAPEAQVRGALQRAPWPEHERSESKFPILGFVVWTLGLTVIATLLLIISPAFTRRVSETVRQEFGWSLLGGLILLLVLPPAAAIVLITIVGIPLGLLLLLSFPMMLLLGYVLAGVALGDAGLRRFKLEQADNSNRRILGAFVALLALTLLAGIPVLGGLICLAALLAGTGALLQQLRVVRKSLSD